MRKISRFPSHKLHQPTNQQFLIQQKKSDLLIKFTTTKNNQTLKNFSTLKFRKLLLTFNVLRLTFKAPRQTEEHKT